MDNRGEQIEVSSEASRSEQQGELERAAHVNRPRASSIAASSLRASRNASAEALSSVGARSAKSPRAPTDEVKVQEPEF